MSIIFPVAVLIAGIVLLAISSDQAVKHSVFFVSALGISSLVIGLVLNAIIGFAEELVWRGYIQTRLVGYAGPLKGLLVTSALFALLHFPTRYYLYSGVVLEALVSALLVMTAGLLFGYTMLKSQSIIPSSILHIVSNWSALFWRIYPF